MIELYAVALLGGAITGVSPCIVPVLPVMVAGGASGAQRSRPFLIVLGLVISFSVTELVGSTVLSAIGLPQNFLYWFGIGALLVLAVALMVPYLGRLVEAPFSRLGSSRYITSSGGFVLGLSLGLVFIPCAGPVLAAISAAAANHKVTASSLFVTLFYAIGAAVPLLILALLAQRATTGWNRLRVHLPVVRRAAGAILGVTVLLIAFGLFDSLRVIPGYTSSLQNSIEIGPSITRQLQALSGEHANTFAKAQAKAVAPKTTTPKAASLPVLGTAPNFTGIVAWLNTPGDRPLTLSELRGKVVLVDFWTYSCINCQRSLPHVEAWYKNYAKDGLVIVGVSTPEFAFEHVVSNVRSAAGSLGVRYPIAVDNNYGTWDAYGNEYWPAEYLIDPTGHVRAYDFGEGSYSTMETNIRELLTANGVANLPPRTDVANKTPTQQITQESYIGYEEEQYQVGTKIAQDKTIDYHTPASIPSNSFSFDGQWNDHSQEATAIANSSITLSFTANDVYLVMGGSGTVNVSLDNEHLKTITVNGVPRLYTLLSGTALRVGELKLNFSPGVQAYDFTFG